MSNASGTTLSRRALQVVAVVLAGGVTTWVACSTKAPPINTTAEPPTPESIAPIANDDAKTPPHANTPHNQNMQVKPKNLHLFSTSKSAAFPEELVVRPHANDASDANDAAQQASAPPATAP